MAAPIIPIWLIVVLILAAAAGTGVLAYFATHSGTMFLFIIALIAIFVLVILPNLPNILKWGKDLNKEIKK
jgi:membrane protein YdbS with pleckstrin-like domain